MTDFSTTEPTDSASEHFAKLKGYAQRVLVNGQKLSADETEDKETRLAALRELTDRMGLPKRTSSSSSSAGYSAITSSADARPAAPADRCVTTRRGRELSRPRRERDCPAPDARTSERKEAAQWPPLCVSNLIRFALPKAAPISPWSEVSLERPAPLESRVLGVRIRPDCPAGGEAPHTGSRGFRPVSPWPQRY